MNEYLQILNSNFYIVVLISTILGYLVLKYNKTNSEKPKSNLIYVLLIPIIMCSIKYYCNSEGQLDININTNTNSINSSSSEILSGVYPASTSVS